jgi:hypothetical protein
MANEHCNCPGGGTAGGRAVISPTGCCPRCGAQGSRRASALRDALAAQNWQPAIEDARQAGWLIGYLAGMAEGRRQAIEALSGGDWLGHVTATASTRHAARLAVMPAPPAARRGAAA